MCGLVGVAGDITGAWKDVFNELLLIDVVRGPHSTGVGFVSRKGDLNVVKRPGHPFKLLETVEYDKAMDNKNSYKVLIGHNRFATIGDLTEENAHPFQFEHTIGAHNGTLDKQTIRFLHDHLAYDTDSEAIFATIDRFGVKDTMSRVTGAWALTWYDAEKNTINFLRNDKRPLFYCYNKERTVLAWASEVEMLKYVLKRKHQSVFGEDGGDFFQATKDIHFSWEVPKAWNDKFDAPEQTKVEGKPVKHQNFTQPHHGYSPTTTTTAKTSSPPVAYTSKVLPKVIPFHHRVKTKKFRHPYQDMYGHTLNKLKFEDMVTEGCIFCNSNGQKFGEFIQILGPYYGKFTPYICEDCYNEPEKYEIASYAI